MAMKRRRSSPILFHRKSNELENKANDQPEVQSLGTTITDLPFCITTDILLRLPLRSVLVCKCVCKTLRTLISDSLFVKLHYEKSPVGILIRTNHTRRVSRNLHFLDLAPMAPRKFTANKYCDCDYDSDNMDKYLCCKFKLPLRDAKMVLDNVRDSGKRRRKYMACKPRDDKFGVVNSCNGLICLCDPKYRSPIAVCNPVTGEFIRLPEGNKIENLKPMDCGFGFYAKANKYVVVRIYSKYELSDCGSGWKFLGIVAEMHTLGTSTTWESLGRAPYSTHNGWRWPTYLNGIYWLGFGYECAIKIVFFDLEDRKFKTVPSPPASGRYYSNVNRTSHICMGTLNGELYICDSVPKRIRLWVKRGGDCNVWTQLFSINTNELLGDIRWRYGLYRPLKSFDREGLLIIMSVGNNLIWYETINRCTVRKVEIKGTTYDPFLLNIFAHKPSLVSMKEAVVMEDNVEVQNVYSRCGKFSLREDREVLICG